jgi:hypothetical protein
MKRYLIVFVSLVTLLAFFSSALAIDQTPKESKAKKKEEPIELKEGKKREVKEGEAKGVATPEKKGEKIKEKIVPEKFTESLKAREEQKAKEKKEKYDYFIDKNNNGIDDRLEKKSRKSISPSAIRSIPKGREPVKPVPSIKETEEKKKTEEAPKEKQLEEAKKIEEKKRR